MADATISSFTMSAVQGAIASVCRDVGIAPIDVNEIKFTGLGDGSFDVYISATVEADVPLQRIECEVKVD